MFFLKKRDANMPECKQTARTTVCPSITHGVIDTCTPGQICTNCRGFVARTCKTCNKPVPMERHVQFSKESIERCSLHNDKDVEYYCTSHRVVGCTACMTLDHRNCDVDYIPSVANQIGGYDCYRKLDKALRDLVNKYDEVKKTSAKSVHKVENDFRRSLVGIRQLRKNVNTYFDALESDVVKVLLNSKDGELSKMKAVSTKCVTVIAELNAAASELEYKRHYGQQDQFFIAIKKSEAALKRLQGELEMVASQSKVNRFKYQRSAEVTQALKCVRSLGDIVPMKDSEDAECAPSGDVSVSLGTESRNCSITGVANLQDGLLVIADCNNKSVKVVNVEKNKVMADVTLSSEPWDLTQVSSGQLAVTLPKEKKIVFLSLSTETGNEDYKHEETQKECRDVLPRCSLKVESDMSVNGKCTGITSYGRRLIVTFCEPAKVEILELNGRVLRRIGENVGRDLRLVTPEYVALSPDQATIYVTDKGAGKVACFGIEGKLLCVYTGTSKPGGVTVDQDGTVFVCDTSESEVHALTPEGAKVKTLLGNSHGLDGPKCIAYSEAGGKLIVGTAARGLLSSFIVRYA